jgi:hypothetical protein
MLGQELPREPGGSLTMNRGLGDYDTYRPHRSPGFQTPAELAGGMVPWRTSPREGGFTARVAEQIQKQAPAVNL